MLDDLLVVVLLGIGDHGLLSRLPVSRAHFSVDVGVLEGLHQSQVLIRVSSDGQVVDGHMSHNSLGVNDVGGSESNTGIITFLDEASVIGGDLLGHVREQGDVQTSKTSFLSRLEGVLHVGEFGVDGAGQNLNTDFSEFLSLVAEGDDFSGAHKGEVQGVEEEHNVLAGIVGKLDVDEVSIVPSGGLELGSGSSDK